VILLVVVALYSWGTLTGSLNPVALRTWTTVFVAIVVAASLREFSLTARLVFLGRRSGRGREADRHAAGVFDRQSAARFAPRLCRRRDLRGAGGGRPPYEYTVQFSG
jgi:hypothetical protein